MTFRRAIIISIITHILLLGLGFGCGGGGNSSEKKQTDSVQFDAVNKEERLDKNDAITVELDHREIVDKPKDASADSALPADKDGTQSAKSAEKDCPGGKFFGGIGVQLAYFRTDGIFGVYDGVLAKISIIYPGYPAAREHMQVGDLIYICDNIEDFNKNENRYIVGEVGTPITLRVIRPSDNMQEYKVTLVRDKICYQEPEEKKDASP